MAKKMSGKSFMIRIAVLFIYSMCAADTMLEVALGDLTLAFADASPVLISLVSNFHVFALVLSSLILVPILTARVDKRKLMIWAMLAYGVFGAMGAVYSPSIYVILAEQFFFGISMSFAGPLSMTYVNELYDGTDRENMIGWAQTFSSLVATGLSVVAGVLCAMHWRYTFWTYALFIIGTLLMLLLPSSKPQSTELVKGGEKKTRSGLALYTPKQRVKLLLLVLFIVFIMMGIVTFNIKLSIIIEERGLGTAALAGVAKAATTVGTLALSAFYGVLQKALKRYVFFVGLVITGVGCFIGAFASTPFMIVLGTFLGGAGMGISAPAFTSTAMTIGCPDAAPFGAALVSAIMGLGMFLSTFFELIVGLFVEATTKNILVVDGFMFVALIVVLVIYFIWDPLKGVDYVPEAGEEKV